jgi:uncharacterized repeat protein (TIGR01451 family)
MNNKHWWTLLGLSGTSLAALVLGPTVWGQPERPVVLPPPPIEVIQTDLPKPSPKAPVTASDGMVVMEQPGLPSPRTEEPRSGPKVEMPSPMPLFPESTPVVVPPPKQTALPPLVPAPAPTRSKTEMPPLVPPDAKSERVTTNPPSSDVQSGRQQPAVSVEWVGPTSVRIHQPLSCQIVVRNTSTTPAQNVIVRHRLGEGVTCKTSEPRPGQDTDELVWNLGTLAPQQAKRVEMMLVARTRGALNCQAAVTFTAIAGHQVQVREPKLAIKLNGPEKVIAGDSVTITLAVSNPGDGAAEAVKLKAILPEGVEHPHGKSLDFDIGTLAANETRNMQLVCKTKGGGPQKCEISVCGDGGLLASDSAQFEVLMPKIDVAVTGPKLRYLDRHAVYVLKVTNPGNAPASRVEVQQAIPAGFKFHQANSGGLYQEATRLVTWRLGELPAGQSKDIAVDLIPIEAGEHQFVVHAHAAGGLKSQADARTTVEGLPSLFIEVAHVDDPLEVGAETVFEIRLTNTGTKAETNVEVACTLPEQLEYRGKGSTALKCRQEGREVIFEPVARLAPRGDVIYRVQVRGVAPGDVRFRTRIKADGLRDPVLREESIRIYSDGAPVRSAPPMTSAPVAPTLPAAPKAGVPEQVTPLTPPNNVVAMPPSVAPAPTPVMPMPVEMPKR